MENNKYKGQVDILLEDYFANIKSGTSDEFGIYEDWEDPDLVEAINYGLSQLDEELTEEEFKQLRPGDFVLVKQFQVDYDPEKQTHPVRPFLITHILNDRAFGFTISTQTPPERYILQYLEISDYTACGLSKLSYIELESCNYHKRQFMRDKVDDKICIGHITSELKSKLLVRMQQISSAKNWLDDLNYYPNKVAKNISEM